MLHGTVSAGEIEAFVVERIREIGRDPSIIAATLRAAEDEARRRRPELEAEGRCSRSEIARIEQERRNLVDAVASGGSASPTLMARVAELDDQLMRLENRKSAIEAELVEMETAVVDEDDLRAALARFEPIWGELVPREKTRLIRLLIERIDFDGATGDVEITYRGGGIRVLAEEDAA